jgi:hypothetical protein
MGQAHKIEVTSQRETATVSVDIILQADLLSVVERAIKFNRAV